MLIKRLWYFKFILTAFLFLLVWVILSAIVKNSRLFPSPLYVWTISLPSLVNFSPRPETGIIAAFRVIAENSLVSVIRCIIGVAMGYVLGIYYGLGIHYFFKLKRSSHLILKLLRSIPLLGIIPLFLFWFGGTEAGIITYIGFAVFIVIATNTYEAVFNVPQTFRENAKLLGASRLQMFRTIIYPFVSAELAGAITYLSALIWAISLAAEYLAGSSGLGFLIYQSYSFADMGKLIVLSLVYSFLSLITFYILKSIILKKLTWK